MTIHRIDNISVYLSGDLEEEVYMTPPKDFNVNRKEYLVWIKHSLYGLKQAPRF